MNGSKITIDYKPQKVRTYREVELPDRLLTLEDIGKYLKEGEKFGFFQREEGGLGLPVEYISIHGYRDETKEEIDIRVAKSEKYNENYEKHHAKNARLNTQTMLSHIFANYYILSHTFKYLIMNNKAESTLRKYENVLRVKSFT